MRRIMAVIALGASIISARVLMLSVLMSVAISLPSQAANVPDSHLLTITKITDGDSLRAGDIRIRIHGIDAPEMRQFCQAQTRYNCGKAARDYLIQALGDAPTVRCVHLDTDRYNRWVMRCYHKGVDIGAGMVRAGWAVAYRRYSKDYIADEQQAKSQKKGMWAGTFTLPWQWRRDN